MMFDLILRYLRPGRMHAEFAQSLDQESDRGYVLDVAGDRSWYLTLGATIDEFKESPGAVLRLHDMNHGEVCRASVVHNKNRKILIGDIQAFIENKGYGSIMLRNIITLAKNVSVREITGNLSSTDSDHFDKLKHFYDKFGFMVKIDAKRQSGTIRLPLA